MGETIKGFQGTEGVSYDRKSGTITIKDPNSPAIQKVIADMKANNLDHNVFLNKVEAPKQETPQTKPVPADTHTHIHEGAGPAQQQTPQQPASNPASAAAASAITGA